jgi:hypothetical protein
MRKTTDYISEQMAARQLGVDAGVMSRQIAAGDYGKVIRQGGRVFISMRALQIKSRRLIYNPLDKEIPR